MISNSYTGLDLEERSWMDKDIYLGAFATNRNRKKIGEYRITTQKGAGPNKPHTLYTLYSILAK